MTQKGPHTWDMILKYHRCPFCGYIIESRKGYEYVSGHYEKMLECPRCKKSFVEAKQAKQSFGPLIGEAQPVEIEWE